MASLDRVKVLVLGDSGELLNPTLGLLTLLNHPITNTSSLRLITGSCPRLKSFSKPKDYTSQRTLLCLTLWWPRADRAAECRPFSTFAAFDDRLLDDRNLARVVNSFVLKRYADIACSVGRGARETC